MSGPTDLERASAADPACELAQLADLAHRYAELRPVVAANPSAYDGLLEWLGQLGDPAVDRAIAARNGTPIAAAAAAQPTVTKFAATARREHQPGEVEGLRVASISCFVLAGIILIATVIKSSVVGFTSSEAPVVMLGFGAAIAAAAIGGAIERRMR